ncbi:MAG: CDP-glycerol glycerophosphotransferase family protein [Kangiellaceae bacterium]|nr:CDP-glycerol glycerophosphotransferase family protein [Kangiellaceae bacterium]
MKILFDVAHLYYLPHFTPVIEQLISLGIKAGIVFHHKAPSKIKLGLNNNVSIYEIAENDIMDFYQQKHADWIIFGHASEHAKQINAFAKTGMILHGLGPKSTYYNASSGDIQYRFVESQERCDTLQQLYPDKTFVTTGYTKLDPIINNHINKLHLPSLGLDPKKKTILYSPTFYPSTIENFPKSWPEHFSDYNILIKPHYFSLIKKSYKKQRILLKHWQKYDNVYLADINEQSLLPFMHTADIMISETSSALFEFMALDKPIIVCHFLKLRLGYRGFLKYRLGKRLSDDYKLFSEIGSNINKYQELTKAIQKNINNPQLYQAQRKHYTKQIVGNVDGLSSKRVAEYLITRS